MGKMLVVAVWLAGIAAIMIAASLLAARAGRGPEVRAGGHLPLAARAGATRSPAEKTTQRTLRDVVRFLVLLLIGIAAVYAIMAVLGLLVIHEGHIIDKPLHGWIGHHRVRWWTREMSKATKVGDTWTTRGAAATAAVCLAVTWRRMRWLPPVALAALVLIQHPLTRLIHLADPRVGPPGFPAGTFPSGGSERTVVFYGLIAYLIWREFSGRRRAAVWSGAIVAALAFHEGYSRVYLGMHWATDVLSGWVYGLLLLAAFITAVRLVAGPAHAPDVTPAAPAPTRPARAVVGEGPR